MLGCELLAERIGLQLLARWKRLTRVGRDCHFEARDLGIAGSIPARLRYADALSVARRTSA